MKITSLIIAIILLGFAITMFYSIFIFDKICISFIKLCNLVNFSSTWATSQFFFFRGFRLLQFHSFNVTLIRLTGLLKLIILRFLLWCSFEENFEHLQFFLLEFSLHFINFHFEKKWIKNRIYYLEDFVGTLNPDLVNDIRVEYNFTYCKKCLCVGSCIITALYSMRKCNCDRGNNLYQTDSEWFSNR